MKTKFGTSIVLFLLVSLIGVMGVKSFKRQTAHFLELIRWDSFC